jgi:hypothetical protein
MLKKVVYVALLVSDQDKALDFYATVAERPKSGRSRSTIGRRGSGGKTKAPSES